MRNKKIIVLVILSVAAVFSLLYGIITPSKRRARSSSKPVNIQPKKVATTAKGITLVSRRTKRSNYSSWGRSPFILQETTDNELALNGILWDAKNPQAVINGEIVGVGDKINKYSVVDIDKNKVILNDGTEDCELKLVY